MQKGKRPKGDRATIYSRLNPPNPYRRSADIARASLWLRPGKFAVEVLVQAFEDAPGELGEGHLALLLGETGAPQAIDVLKPHLADANRHVRYLSALALDLLGFEEKQVLDDLLWVKVPAGEFILGSESVGETPRKVEMEAYGIDRFPLTNGQYRRFMEAGGYQEPRYWSTEGWAWKESGRISELEYGDDSRFNVASAPVVGISWYEAEAYANWQHEQTGKGCRLLTESEWERAARGDGDARAYPWGDAFEVRRCNTATDDWEPVIGQPSPVGSYPEGISPHGCYDMAGNVWEWVESLYGLDPEFLS